MGRGNHQHMQAASLCICSFLAIKTTFTLIGHLHGSCLTERETQLLDEETTHAQDKQSREMRENTLQGGARNRKKRKGAALD